MAISLNLLPASHPQMIEELKNIDSTQITLIAMFVAEQLAKTPSQETSCSFEASHPLRWKEQEDLIHKLNGILAQAFQDPKPWIQPGLVITSEVRLWYTPEKGFVLNQTGFCLNELEARFLSALTKAF